jgi:hypothetical protein
VLDAQHFAVGFAFQRGGLIERVSDGNQVLAFVEAIRGGFTRAILEALDLGQGVPPQVFGFATDVDGYYREVTEAMLAATFSMYFKRATENVSYRIKKS